MVGSALSRRNRIHMKILVIDDHELIREALQGVLREWRRDAAILEASDCRQAMQLIEQHTDLELVLLDLNLPDGDGFHMLADCRSAIPPYRSSFFRRAMTATACCGHSTSARSASFQNPRGVPSCSALCNWCSPAESISHPTSSCARSCRLRVPKQSAGDRSNVSPSDFGLTQRQLEVLAHMMQGKSNKTICRALGVAEATVKSHVTAILKALKVSSRIEAVIAVGQLGWKLPSVGESTNGPNRHDGGTCGTLTGAMSATSGPRKYLCSMFRSAIGRTGLCSR